MQPRQMRETCRPVLPSRLYSISGSLIRDHFNEGQNPNPQIRGCGTSLWYWVDAHSQEWLCHGTPLHATGCLMYALYQRIGESKRIHRLSLGGSRKSGGLACFMNRGAMPRIL